jgi:bacillithiol system protein YtxJ
MIWIDFESLNQLDEIDALSKTERPVTVFKHSTRCAISSMALRRMQSANAEEHLKATTVYFLDLIKFRDISNAVSKHYGIDHESPQLLIVKNGSCIESASHNGITKEILLENT